MGRLRSGPVLLMVFVILAPLACAEPDNAAEEAGAWLTMAQGKVPNAPELRIKVNGGVPFELKDTLKPNLPISSAASFLRVLERRALLPRSPIT